MLVVMAVMVVVRGEWRGTGVDLRGGGGCNKVSLVGRL